MSAPITERELFDEIASRLAIALEAMAAQKSVVSWDPLPSAPSGDAIRWRQGFPPFQGAAWIVTPEADWAAAGKLILNAAGVDEADLVEYKSTYLEILNQTFSGLGQGLTAKLKRSVLPAGGAEDSDVPGPGRWAEIHVQLGGIAFSLTVGTEDEFLAGLIPQAAAQNSQPQLAPAAPAPPPASRTLDLLLDVELPVSVSFGRAQIPLKDVLKLTTGSIVELNRPIAEPVDIIVNNCVIARGEVVVVDGNFGVRIQQVISRQERLRTLQ